ncbi:MAG: NTP transferase domain-containing protein [Nanoarchaeota archaeon]|nr:NTP transferase domain-containing protein [Nanoarchaeota archaeon]MBU1644624.1 NTP transferase domain-containing protein [Nanoarchaeota archaeon]MBU1977032.1 NTP transferase domain-containing protein [Nanoarchaeota archaeon]
MKAVILAAGKGTRMLPLTEKVPKVLIEINGKPFLYYVLKSLQKAGYDDLCLVVGYKKEKIKEFLDEFGFKAELVEQKEQLGTGHALLQARDFCENDDFIVLGGDNLWSVDDLKDVGRKRELNYISGIEVKDSKGYGILIAKGDLLAEIKEKPERDYGNLINAGLYKFKPEIWCVLEKVKPSPRGEIELTDAITSLAKKGKVKVLKLKWWLDLGKIEDIPKVEKFLSENRVC